MNDCVGRFCAADGAPTPGCVAAVTADVALCGAYAGACADPGFDPGPADCARVAACVSACPTVACADACVPAGLPAAVDAQLGAYFGCIQAECPDGAQLCVVDRCWGELDACYGDPEAALTCAQIVDCTNACEVYSCGLNCLGSAASEAVAVGHEGAAGLRRGDLPRARRRAHRGLRRGRGERGRAVLRRGADVLRAAVSRRGAPIAARSLRPARRSS